MSQSNLVQFHCTNPHAGDDDVNDVDLKEYQIKIKTKKELIYTCPGKI